MRKLIFIQILIIAMSLTWVNVCLGYTMDDCLPQAISGVSMDGNFAPNANYPISNLCDGDLNSMWNYTASGNDQWLDLYLGSNKYIDYLQVSGFSGRLDDVSFYYLDLNGIWQPMLRNRHVKINNGLIDLSWSWALSSGLRMVIHNSTVNTADTKISELQIFGHSREAGFLFNGVINTTNEDSRYTQNFLNDGNTQTSWRSKDNNPTTLTYSLNELSAIVTHIKLFTKNGSGNATIQALVDGVWTPVGNQVDLSSLPDGWHLIEVPELTTNEIKIQLVSNSSKAYVGGISEVEIWGKTEREIQKTLLVGENLTGNMIMGLNVSDLAAWNQAELWLTFQTGVSSYITSLKVNGLPVANPRSTIVIGNYTLVKIPLDLSLLQEGNNNIAVDLGSGQALDCSLVLSNTSGRIKPTFIGSTDDYLELYNGQRFATVNNITGNAIDISWGKPVSLDLIRLNGNYNMINLTKLSIWQNNSWVTVPLSNIAISGKDIRFANENPVTTKVRLEFADGTVVSLTEIELFGSYVQLQTAPVVKILEPQNNQFFQPGSTVKIMGYVDNPDVSVTVNGASVALSGHYFTHSIQVTNTGTNSQTVLVRATDALGQAGEASFIFYVGNPIVLTCNQDETTYTAEPQINISGTATGASYVKINNQSATLSSDVFAGSIGLTEGDNRILIEAVDSTGRMAQLERHIILDTQAPVIKVANPIDLEDNSSPLLIRGSFSDISPVTIKVNNQSIETIDGIFETVLDLPIGSNTISILATDATGHQTETIFTVNVTQKDSASALSLSKTSASDDDYNSPDFNNTNFLNGYQDAPNPFKSYFSNATERVSNGNLSLTATDLTLPGRNGLDLTIKRIYGSASAYSDSTYRNRPKIRRTIPVSQFGDTGWMLNLPCLIKIKYDGGSDWYLRMPEGQTVKVDNFGGWECHKEGVHFKTAVENIGVKDSFRDGSGNIIITSYYTKRTIISSDGSQYIFDDEGRLIRQTDATGKSSIEYTYAGNLLDKIVDSAGRIVKFNYNSNQLLESIVVNGKTVVRYEYTSDNYLGKVSDQLGRVTEYSYTNSYNFRTSYAKNSNRFKNYNCNLKLLNQIIYPTGMVSKYDYLELSQDSLYSYRCLLDKTDPHCNEYYYGRKFIINNHDIDSNEIENYTYIFNTPVVANDTNHVFPKNFLPPNYYLTASTINSSEAKIEDSFIQIKGEDEFSSNPSLQKYSGSFLKTRRTYKSVNPGIEYEKIEYDYKLPSQELTIEVHTRGNHSYTLTTDYDKWGNIILTNNNETHLKKTITYNWDKGNIFNLPDKITTENYNPVSGVTSTNITQYTYNDTVIPIKPDTITVSNGSDSYVSRMSYWDNGDLKSREVPVREGVNLKVDFYYQYTLNNLGETVGCLSQETTLVTDAAGVQQTAVNKSHCNYYGLKDWEMNPLGYVTAYRYDALGRMTLVVLADDNDPPFVVPGYATNVNISESSIANPLRKYIYNDAENSAIFINENCQKAKYLFDGMGRIRQSVSYHNGTPQITQMDYDIQGRVTRVVDPRGVATTASDGDFTTWYEYDGLNRVTKVIRPSAIAGDKSVYVAVMYNDVNNSIEFYNEKNEKIATEEYDLSQQLIRAIKYSRFGSKLETYVWEYQYDSLGNKVFEKKPDLVDQGTNTSYPVAKQYGYHPVSNKLVNITLPETFGLVSLNVAQAMDKTQLINSTGLIQPTLKYQLDYMGNQTQSIDANGYLTTYRYDELGRLIEVRKKFKQFSPDTRQEVEKEVVTTHKYDLNGNKIETKTNGKVWKYEYAARGLLLSETDPAGITTQYRYDPLGNKIAVIDPRNSNLETDRTQKVWYRFEGEGVNRKLILGDPRSDKSFTTWMVYDDLNRLARTVLPDNSPPDNPFVSVPNYDNSYTETSYDAVGNKLSVKDANGVIAASVYNARNQVIESSINGVLKQKFDYDKTGNQTGVYTRVKDNTFSYSKLEYDSLGRLRRSIAPNNKDVVVIDYDAYGNKIQVQNGSIGSSHFQTTTYQYNQLGQLIWVKDPLGNKTVTKYDPNGNPVGTITANGLVTMARYDEMGRVVQSKDPLGISAWSSYDLNGNRSGMIDRRGTVWKYCFTDNNLVQKITLLGADSSAYEVNYQYDQAGNRMKVWDAGNTIIYNDQIADPLNRIHSVERQFDNSAYRTEYQYNPGGQLLKLIYPGNAGSVTYHYDSFNRMSEVVGFTKTQGVVYAEDGLIESLTYNNGVATSYSYDENRRLQVLNTAFGNTGIIKTSFTYDAWSNITKIADQLKGQNYIYKYNDNNWLTGAVTPGEFINQAPTGGAFGLTINDYKGANQLDFGVIQGAVIQLDQASSSIGIDLGSAKSIAKLELAPDASHRGHRLTNRSFDIYSSGDNSTYTLIPASKWSYQRETDGTITVKFKELQTVRYLKLHVKYDERTMEFIFDTSKVTFLNEIAKMLRIYEGSSAQSESYQYDKAGNRIQLKVSRIETVIEDYQYYPDSDRVMTTGKYAFVYDNAGNVIQKGNSYRIENNKVVYTKTNGDGVEYWAYKFDLLNRLVKVFKNGVVTAEYDYDPEGLRVVKRAHGDKIHYVFEGTEPIYEKRISDNKIHCYIFGFGKQLARVDGTIGGTNSKVYYYHTDHLGSIKAVTNAQGKVVWNADYFPFGTRFAATGSDGFEEWKGFGGKEYDPDAGLYYFNARWYDPELGRFISEDPVADLNSPNLYSFCGNNPVMRTDSTGEFWEVVLASAIIGGISAEMNGGDFLSGFVQGAFWGMFAAGVGEIIKASSWGQSMAQLPNGAKYINAARGAIVSGTQAAVSGGNSLKEAGISLITDGIMAFYSKFIKNDFFNCEFVVSGVDGGLNATIHGEDFGQGFGSGFGNRVLQSGLSESEGETEGSNGTKKTKSDLSAISKTNKFFWDPDSEQAIEYIKQEGNALWKLFGSFFSDASEVANISAEVELGSFTGKFSSNLTEPMSVTARVVRLSGEVDKTKVTQTINVKLSPDGDWKKGRIIIETKTVIDCKLIKIDQKGNISILLGQEGILKMKLNINHSKAVEYYNKWNKSLRD